MHWSFEFGTQSASVTIERPRVLGHFQGSRALPIEDPGALVRALAENPLGAPPLARAFVPGDHVALVLDRGLPSPAPIVEALLAVLAGAGVAPGDVTILGVGAPPPEGEAREWIGALAPEFRSAQYVAHDPADEQAFAYLASTRQGQRVYLDRRLTDADAFLVVGRSGFDSLVGHAGAAGLVFPALSNARTLNECRQVAMQGSRGATSLLERQHCEEVGWLAGLYYAVSVALNRGNEVEAVWLGEFQSVGKQAAEHTRVHWSFDPPDESPAVVLGVVSKALGPCDWEALAAALETTSAVAGRDSKIALLTDLAAPLGASGRWLIDNDNPWEVLARLRQSDDEDNLITARCAAALAEHKIHLLSALEPGLVESMGMVPLASPREVERMLAREETLFVIEDADRSRVRARGPGAG